MTFRSPIKLSHILAQIKDRLSSDATLEDILYGPGHIYLEGEDYSQPEGQEGTPWVRVVVAPATPLWPNDDAPGILVRRSFIVRTECARFLSHGYDPQLALEAVQGRCQQLLDRWAPPPIGGETTRVGMPIYHHRVIEPRILWDEFRRLHFLTSEYRMEVTSD